MKLGISIAFEPRDMWIGLFWDTDHVWRGSDYCRALLLYICVIPMLPICIVIPRTERP